MKNQPDREFNGQSVGADSDTPPGPDCHLYPEDPRSCLEPDSCGCYVDHCEYFGVSPEDCGVDTDILGGA